MALSKSSKILIDDINTALSGKIDTAGTGLSKDGTSLALASVVTAGNAGPSANATLAYSGTFTVPYITYDAYGRVTGRTNRTMTMPAAPSGGSDTCANFACWTNTYNSQNAFRVGSGSFSKGSIVSSGSSWSFTTWVAPSGGTWQIVSLCR